MGNSDKRVYSIRQCTGRKRKVLYKSSFIMLEDVSLVVQASGRQSTVEKLKAANGGIAKNIHAFLRGTLVVRGRNAIKAMREQKASLNNPNWKPVGYSPLLTNTWRVLNSYSISQEKNIHNAVVAKHANTAFLHADGIIVN
jgi:hypothetical protein